MLGNPHLVIAELLGQLEECKIVVEALDDPCQIGKLAQAKDAEFCFRHVLFLFHRGAFMVAGVRASNDPGWVRRGGRSW
jgi:hypothetical protein